MEASPFRDVLIAKGPGEAANTSHGQATGLPYLGSSREVNSSREEGKPRRAHGLGRGPADRTVQPQSARNPRDEKANRLTRDEETIRQVYKKHAQTFFEEVKLDFQKEAEKLRKQVQKAVVKAAVQDSPDQREVIQSASPETVAPANAEMQTQVSELHRQFLELKASLAGGVASATADSSMYSNDSLGILAERLARQQEELRNLFPSCQERIHFGKESRAHSHVEGARTPGNSPGRAAGRLR